MTEASLGAVISVMLAVEDAGAAARWYAQTPGVLGAPSVRVEVFVDDPDGFIGRAVAAGADGGVDPIREHQMPWGPHRQGGFTDPFGHLWLVGDRSPLERHLFGCRAGRGPASWSWSWSW